jgi:C-terminal processing protease CtpA/Prc
MILSNIPLVSRQFLLAGMIAMAASWGALHQPRPALQTETVQCNYSAPTTTCPAHSECTRERTADFGGVGMYVVADSSHDDRFTISEALPDTPAERAGLKAGDVVEKIDGQDIKEMPTTDAVMMVRGEAGTTVSLNVYRPSTEERFQLEITRAMIHEPEMSSR